jgi:hypothetical protein
MKSMKMWAVSLLLTGVWSCGLFSCEADLSIPEVTSTIINNGLVMVYMTVGSGQVALPSSGYEYLLNPGIVTVGIYDGTGSTPPYNQFKVVIVENWKSGQFNHIDKNDFRAMSKIASKVIDVEINN